eukprot:CAMPEP_0178998478 /NCGR_PEP_ID=MMETSP0795-20121207/9532_1 /TAXON_ID=88552 /ORGANISM="Amoebophrya sp., Strain Ameob2" /LENGTH=732 /DNA_ID=CAMNT_0020691155 /DNA_START=145 /DNA_END=2343 /DNA_ORIENTATION=-
MVAPEGGEVAPVLLSSSGDSTGKELSGATDKGDIEASLPVQAKPSELSSGGHTLSTGRVSKQTSVFHKQKTWQDPRAEFLTHQVRLMIPPLIVFIGWMCFRATGGCFYESADIISAYYATNTAVAAKATTCGLLTSEASCNASADCGWHKARSGYSAQSCMPTELSTIENFRFVFPSVITATIWESAVMLFFLNYGGIWILLKIWRVMPRETFWVWRALFLIIQPALFSMGFYLAWQQGQFDDRWTFRTVCTFVLPFAFSAVAGASWGCKPPEGMWMRIFRASFYILTFGLYFLGGVVLVENAWLSRKRKAEIEDAGLMTETGIDIAACIALFSFYIPYGSRVVTGQYLRLTKMVGMEIQSRRARESFFACARACFNVVMDMYRFCYGRALLLRMSPIAFVFILVKDVASDLFQFALKYQESLQVFLMRLDQDMDNATEDMELTSLESIVIRTIRVWQCITARFGFLGEPAICWWVQFDCDAADDGARIVSREQVQESAGASISVSQMLGMGRRHSETEIETAKYKKFLTFANTRMVADNVPYLTPLTEEVTKKEERYWFSCSEEDMEKVLALVEFWQREIFVRFQIRMAAKLFSSIGLLLGMLLALQTNSAFIPGFPRSELIGKPGIDLQWVGYLIAFVLADTCTWVYTTLYVHLRGVKSWWDVLGQFQDLFSWDEDVIFRMFWGNGLYFMFLMYTMMVSGHNTERLQHVTGVETLTFDHVKEVCGGHFPS